MNQAGSAVEFAVQEDISVEVTGALGVITLTREAALNALTHAMLRTISSVLDEWERDANIHHIVIRGRGRAFSAGGDLLDLYERGRAGNPNYSFFQDEYRLNARLGIFPKPIVALIDGIVMGGGVGVAVHGRYRVMTENAVFSMPEVGIGFFPDVGGSFFLPRLPNRMGYYLGLTGARIRAPDAHKAKIATHVMPADSLDALTKALATDTDTDAVLNRFHDEQMLTDTVLDHDEIESLFTCDTLEGIVANLDRAAPDSRLAASALKAIARNSPTSVAVAFRQIRNGEGRSLAECMRMEYRILVRMLEGPDFYEGIRAVIVDKTNDPQWRPDSADALSEDRVDAFFKPLGEDELVDVPELP
ncbi:MAG: enoyl-CoA hydratase/isomerase family protein [Alphaproteobacteria bacterium]|nr:enoyl-CoA hydratase/isomerase family protein [Alphaproteobacteria bacterium]